MGIESSEFPESDPNEFGESPTGEVAEERVQNKFFEQAKDYAKDEVKESFVSGVARTALSQEVAIVTALSVKSVQQLEARLLAMSTKKFASKLGRLCGKKAITMLLKKAGIMRAGMVGLALLEPSPIGEAVSLLFLAATAKDLYDLSNMIWEGYKLSEEMNIRMGARVDNVNILGPPEVLAKYKDVIEDGEGADPVRVEQMLAEPTISVRMHHAGFGWGHWDIKNNDIQSLALYDLVGEHVAGINEDNLAKIEEAYAQVDLSTGRTYGTLGGDYYGGSKV